MTGARVEIDTRELVAGMRQLGAGLDRGISPTAGQTANAVADRLRRLVPVRTGALRNSVSTERIPDGAQVHYGGRLPYAGYIDGRTGCTTSALEGADREFYDAMQTLGAREVKRL